MIVSQLEPTRRGPVAFVLLSAMSVMLAGCGSNGFLSDPARYEFESRYNAAAVSKCIHDTWSAYSAYVQMARPGRSYEVTVGSDVWGTLARATVRPHRGKTLIDLELSQRSMEWVYLRKTAAQCRKPSKVAYLADGQPAA